MKSAVYLYEKQNTTTYWNELLFRFFSYEMENTRYGAADKRVVCKNDIGHVHSI